MHLLVGIFAKLFNRQNGPTWTHSEVEKHSANEIYIVCIVEEDPQCRADQWNVGIALMSAKNGNFLPAEKGMAFVNSTLVSQPVGSR